MYLKASAHQLSGAGPFAELGADQLLSRQPHTTRTEPDVHCPPPRPPRDVEGKVEVLALICDTVTLVLYPNFHCHRDEVETSPSPSVKNELSSSTERNRRKHRLSCDTFMVSGLAETLLRLLDVRNKGL
ncbi:unnamed protein product [Pleuronectes platessa]|uniref:Uncharacterized protein n=1 Tax=Pleuronectes platessa TaxID=8262 RepID=A0A9N7UKG3_PLEPL|nr:unnamed protein product [Pleuronectes platessa]